MKRRLLILALIVSMLSGCDGSGDRVLVGKYLYDTEILPPARYDVVVFKFPEKPIEKGTPKNYIKRLLGLPGEIIAIFLGRLYAFSHTGAGAPEGISNEEWESLTKPHKDPLDLWSDPPKNHATAKKLWDMKARFKILQKPPEVMKALSRPVFDNDHQAKDLAGVLPDRWAPQGGGSTGWLADNPQGFKNTGAGTTEEWLRYRHILRPSNWPAADAPKDVRDEKIAEIKAGEHRPQLITDIMGYNTYMPRKNANMPPAENWVGDLMLVCKLTVDQPQGEFWMELSKGVDRFQARFDLTTGDCSLYRLSEHKTKQIVENGQNKMVSDWQFLDKAKTRVKAAGDFVISFANYDERLTLWVDRDLPFDHGHAYAAPAKVGPDSLNEPGNNDLQPASLCGVGAKIKVHAIKLWRDTYYTNNDLRALVQGDDWQHPNKWDDLRNTNPATYYVYPGHYLCLGDNSPESSDSRYWGLVPDRLMLGRALLVYFPFERAGTIK